MFPREGMAQSGSRGGCWAASEPGAANKPGRISRADVFRRERGPDGTSVNICSQSEPSRRTSTFRNAAISAESKSAFRRWRETHTSTTGGQVQVLGDTITVTPLQMDVRTTARKAVWLKSKDCAVRILLPESLQVRQEHRRHVVISTDTRTRGNQWAALVNHDTEYWNQVDNFRHSRFSGHSPLLCSVPLASEARRHFSSAASSRFPSASGSYQDPGGLIVGAIIGFITGIVHAIFIRMRKLRPLPLRQGGRQCLPEGLRDGLGPPPIVRNLHTCCWISVP